MTNHKYPKGINFRELSEHRVGVGIHIKQFISYLNALPKTPSGWVNLDIVKRETPSEKGGYTHFAILVEK